MRLFPYATGFPLIDFSSQDQVVTSLPMYLPQVLGTDSHSSSDSLATIVSPVTDNTSLVHNFDLVSNYLVPVGVEQHSRDSSPVPSSEAEILAFLKCIDLVLIIP